MRIMFISSGMFVLRGRPRLLSGSSLEDYADLALRLIGILKTSPLNAPTPNYFAVNGVFPVSALMNFPSFTRRTNITAFRPWGPSNIE